MRLIDADALHDKLQSLAYEDWNQGVITSWANAYNECADIVNDMPTIEPQRMSDDYKTDHGFMWLCPNCGLVVHSDYNKCVRCGKERPIEPQRMRGRWIEYNYPGNEHVYCSECKEEYYDDDLLMGRNDYPNYCPNCGAWMEGQDENR